MRQRTRRNFLKSHHARTYRARRFHNPYFEKKPRRFWWWKYALIGIAALGLIVGVLYGLSSLSWFKITNVTVNDLPTINEDQIRETAWQQIHKRRLFVFPQDSIVFLNNEELYKAIWDTYSLSELTIDRQGDTLVIQATERLTSLVWRTQDHWGLLDIDGRVIRDLSEEETVYLSLKTAGQEGIFVPQTIDPQIPIIYNLSNAEFGAGDQILSSTHIENTIAFDAGLRSRELYPSLYEIDSQNVNWMRAKTPLFDVLFDAEGDYVAQLEDLSIIIKEYTDSLSDLEYIDIRFGNHVYLK